MCANLLYTALPPLANARSPQAATGFATATRRGMLFLKNRHLTHSKFNF